MVCIVLFASPYILNWYKADLFNTIEKIAGMEHLSACKSQSSQFMDLARLICKKIIHMIFDINFIANQGKSVQYRPGKYIGFRIYAPLFLRIPCW